ncbi:MAG: polysaccharide deacetylase family protein [Nocardioides sp.]
MALTFDDGPSSALTPSFLTSLAKRGVPATFFVVGQRVAASPALVRRAARAGHVVGNHSYAHENLLFLTDAGIRSTLRRTATAIRSAGVTPSALMRPPYGAVDDRVRRVAGELGLTSVLWDVDPRDWEFGDAATIARRVLGALHPHGSNVVLLHDGVARSSITLQALPAIVREARARGYCFARLGPGGRPTPPVPAVSVPDTVVREGDPGSPTTLRFTLRLDRPTSRRVSVRVRTASVSAVTGDDFTRVVRRVRFPVGVVRRSVAVSVRGDRIDEARERMRLRLDRGRRLTIADARATGTIRDNDPRPNLDIRDASVVEPLEGRPWSRCG